MKARVSVPKRTVIILKKTVAGLKEVSLALRYRAGLKNMFKDFRGNSGATLIEIALYVALVVIVCIGVITALGDKLQGVFDTITSSL